MANEIENSKQARLIDDNLKRVYQDMISEDIPDRFLNLLDQLKAQDGGAASEEKAEQGDQK
ncbi:hypothetical protein SAMN04488045_1560 [Thalassococcus halodurans]|uniref:Anti-sigma factor NepR domain-containing protein n=1 Tax=Thalassococcus halodurans TaxID=373675 RepID=A0A1H5WRU0_9RHOB|nr:NepR family anti-sigma factor [Thalassococcus halodurans]SEG02065.1 hypothetical protein SAMN04488045_1560 [Thalassococcus halodurans]